MLKKGQKEIQTNKYFFNRAVGFLLFWIIIDGENGFFLMCVDISNHLELFKCESSCGVIYLFEVSEWCNVYLIFGKCVSVAARGVFLFIDSKLHIPYYDLRSFLLAFLKLDRCSWAVEFRKSDIFMWSCDFWVFIWLFSIFFFFHLLVFQFADAKKSKKKRVPFTRRKLEELISTIHL